MLLRRLARNESVAGAFFTKSVAATRQSFGNCTSEKVTDRSGASEGIRTLDIHLGKVTLYQTELRSLPYRLHIVREPFWNASQLL